MRALVDDSTDLSAELRSAATTTRYTMEVVQRAAMVMVFVAVAVAVYLIARPHRREIEP